MTLTLKDKLVVAAQFAGFLTLLLGAPTLLALALIHDFNL